MYVNITVNKKNSVRLTHAKHFFHGQAWQLINFWNDIIHYFKPPYTGKFSDNFKLSNFLIVKIIVKIILT